jgi:hypothetical protein
MRRKLIAVIFLLWRGYAEAGIHEQRLIEAGSSYTVRKRNGYFKGL